MMPKISPKITVRIRSLAECYGTADFMRCDPSQFMHRYSEISDIEVVALLSACLAYGKRSEILVHIQRAIDAFGDSSPAEWCINDGYLKFFPGKSGFFYRIFSYDVMRLFFKSLGDILKKHGTLGDCLHKEYLRQPPAQADGGLATMLGNLFPNECSPLVSKTNNCANKRLNLFLRWMVRDNSPVDMGLWRWYPKDQLLMPLDTHVVTIAKEFGLLPPKATATLKNVLLLTEKMRDIFPDDPIKGDYALFGHGVNQVKLLRKFRVHGIAANGTSP